MIGSLTGTVAEVRPSGSGGEIELDVGGVGYLVMVPTSLLAELRVGETIRLMTHMVVREDSMTLYGFSEPDRRQMFMHLLGVSGVGPKLARAMLSAMDPLALARAVASGDVGALTSVPGVGKRGAERMILELKEKLAGPAEIASGSGSKVSEVREALVGLGYTPAEAREALDHIGAAASEASVEDLVRAALKELSRV
jgi:Holliday junction DNA helicase RuvA